jgi:indole-3-glycerol phosphate synthase
MAELSSDMAGRANGMSFLSSILETTKQSVAERRWHRSLADLQATVFPRSTDLSFSGALESAPVSIIAEFKRKSPSEGQLAVRPDLVATVQAYERAGASAISILTENSRFGGSLDDLRLAREACGLPLLCKDFIVDESQVYEAVEAGADAILLIDAALCDDGGLLDRLRGVAREMKIDVLVEVRDREELERALAVEPELVGINNRNLDDLTTSLQTTRDLVGHIPGHVKVVSESGLRTTDDLRELARMGVDAALIGTAFMKAADPEATCHALATATAAADRQERVAV